MSNHTDPVAVIPSTPTLFRDRPLRRFRLAPTHATALAAFVAIVLEILYYRNAVEALRAPEVIALPNVPAAAPLHLVQPSAPRAPKRTHVPVKARLVKQKSELPVAQSSHSPAENHPIAPAQVTESSVDDWIRKAYESWALNDLVSAKRFYEEALARKPRHRQAQLGLAAIATRQNDFLQARARYQALLERDPLDGDAAAGLINVVSGDSLTEQEDLLKLLITRGVHDPSLYHQLGNIYAAQGRWSDANKNYLEAFRRDALSRKEKNDGDPDFAFNLAVSLDQLGDTNAAARYYSLALAYSQKRASSFSPDQARARLKTLGHGRDGA